MQGKRNDVSNRKETKISNTPTLSVKVSQSSLKMKEHC